MSRENDGMLRAQYLGEIRDAFEHCGSVRGVDYDTLHEELTRLMQSAVFNGLHERDFLDLVRTELPEAWERLRFLSVRKSA